MTDSDFAATLIIMKLFPFSRFIVLGNSMFPTLIPGQSVLVYKWAYIFSKPKIGDIVVIKHNGKEIIKRIKKVLNGGIFVRGDNIDASTDSRNFGFINKTDIIGKVIFIG